MQLARVEIESEVHPDRPNGRPEHHAKAGARAEAREVEIARLEEHIASIDEACRRQRPQHGDAQLAVEDDHAVAAGREPGRRDRLLVAETIECEASNGGVAASEEAFARWQILDKLTIELAGKAV